MTYFFYQCLVIRLIELLFPIDRLSVLLVKAFDAFRYFFDVLKLIFFHHHWYYIYVGFFVFTFCAQFCSFSAFQINFSKHLFHLVLQQIFENARLESESVSNDSTDAEELRRMSVNRSSIAERRRLYEARSNSSNIDDKPPQSPLPSL